MIGFIFNDSTTMELRVSHEKKTVSIFKKMVPTAIIPTISFVPQVRTSIVFGPHLGPEDHDNLTWRKATVLRYYTEDQNLVIIPNLDGEQILDEVLEGINQVCSSLFELITTLGIMSSNR